MAKLEEGFLQTLAALSAAELAKDIRATIAKKRANKR
jgi:hypothetical protein